METEDTGHPHGQMYQDTEVPWKPCTWVAWCEQSKAAERKHAGAGPRKQRSFKSRVKNQERFYNERSLVKPDGTSQYQPQADRDKMCTGEECTERESRDYEKPNSAEPLYRPPTKSPELSE